MKTVIISQPMYFPWAGFLDLLSHADVLIWLDDVQFSKGSFTNRIKVKLPAGCRWLTIPLKQKGKWQRISDLQPATDEWKEGHRAILRDSIDKTAHADIALKVFDDVIIEQDLTHLLIRSATDILSALGLAMPKQYRASDMNVLGKSWQRVIDLVRFVEGTHYLSAAGGANYLEHNEFERANIAVSYMAYDFTPWPQAHGNFTPYVTGLDLLAATGASRDAHFCGKLVPWAKYLAQRR